MKVVFDTNILIDYLSNIAARLRHEHRIRLSDAIIWATAQHRECLLITRNIRDFSATHAGIRVPYKVSSP